MKTLLITLGCSWTQGEGIYSPQVLEQFKKTRKLPDRTAEQIALEKQYAWPTQLAMIKGWDLVNLGVGGGSNSGQAKRLIMGNIQTHDYDRVIVMWMITESCRFSFYVHSELREFQPQDHPHFFAQCSPAELALKQAYIAEISTDVGEQLECEFYLKTVINYCKAMNYEFNYWYARDEWCLNTNKLEGSIDESSAERLIEQQVGHEGFSPCQHPNQLGYRIIAEHLAQLL
jgi:hypothetical protein